MKNIILAIVLIFLCCNPKSKGDNNLIQVKDILYKDNLNNYYFQYAFPERMKVKGTDEGVTKYGYDSIVNLDTKVVYLKNIIDYRTFKKTKGKYEDANYYYTENNFLTVPKFNATKKQ